MKNMFNLAFLLLVLIPISLLSEEGRILRFPNSSLTQITFCHAGDVYVVPIEGGLARRVTSSDGEEMFPRFSPRWKNLSLFR